ncbi:hypothetical protein CWE12_05590 [Aliidiomarina sedimenti]|uniref:DUF4397 domain-containing protein n=1 Tax=Aliidiomarina sedimenti TaxID=1933879 RepID=A0ABY0C0N9_9GAMM|nr:DUF4397 domain-containing protein [Aliidiomarina sedimenti]RUO30714.1 hypothetical protein CWE12_05590 [Aliidiomarina sedimenti]
MIRITQTLAVSSLALALAACNSSSTRVEPTPTPDPDPAGNAQLRIHHVSADAPAVNILADGDILGGLEDVDYQQSSPALEVPEASYNVTVDGILPGGEFSTVIDETLALETDVRYEVFAIGQLGADDAFAFEPFILNRPVSSVTDGDARLWVLHGAPVDVAVDVYLTEPGADIVEGNAAYTLSYKEDSEPFEVPAGDYEVTLTASGDASSVLFSSPLTLNDGDDLMVTATLNTAANADDAPLALLVADGESSSVVYSTTTGADLRVVHAAADVPAVDVYANEVTGTPAVAALAFPEFTDYLNVAAGDYDFLVTLADDADVQLELAASLVDGWQGTVVAAGELGDGSANLQALTFDNRRVATEARVRIVHASPFAGDVDIYVTPTNDFTDSAPAFESVPFNAAELATTGNVPLAAGTYFVTVTLAGQTDAALGPLEVDLEAGGIYTAVAVGNDADSLGLVLMDDLAPSGN